MEELEVSFKARKNYLKSGHYQLNLFNSYSCDYKGEKMLGTEGK